MSLVYHYQADAMTISIMYNQGELNLPKPLLAILILEDFVEYRDFVVL